jgi:hypothetical protein
MEGIKLIKLVDKIGYRFLVEALIDHEICPDDPLTDKVLKGAQGLAYAVWPWDGQWSHIAVSVDWEPGRGCNYFETYRTHTRKYKIRKPIKEIKFVREFGENEILPEYNPLLIKKTSTGV